MTDIRARMPDASAPDQHVQARAFRDLHARPGAFVIPNPWDAGTARILSALGFEALATTQRPVRPDELAIAILRGFVHDGTSPGDQGRGARGREQHRLLASANAGHDRSCGARLHAAGHRGQEEPRLEEPVDRRMGPDARREDPARGQVDDRERRAE